MTETTRWVILDDRDSRLRWSGSWNSVSGDNFNSQGNFGHTYLNTLRGSNTDRSGVSFTFTGNAARIMGTTDLRVTDGVPDPNWECTLDGRVVRRQNPFPYTENNWVFCEFTDVVPGEHTIGLNVMTTGRNFWIDQIQYRPTGTVQGEVIAATRDDADMVYSGSGWGPLANVGHHSMSRGATATFRFIGNGVSLWAMYPHELPHAPGQATYSVDGGSPVSFTIPGGGDMSHYNRRIFEVTGLSQGAHTIAVTYTSTGGSTPLVVERMLISGGTNARAPAPGTPPGSGGNGGGNDGGNDDENGDGPGSGSDSDSDSDNDSNSTSTPTNTSTADSGGQTADIVPGEDLASSLANPGGDSTASGGVPGASAPADHGSSLIGDGDQVGASSNNVPIGAIVGAVIGGLVVICLLLGLMWHRRRKRIRLENDAAAYNPFNMTEHTNNPSGNANLNPQGYFNHVHPSTYQQGPLSTAALDGSRGHFEGPRQVSETPQSAVMAPIPPVHPGARTKGNPGGFNGHYVSNHSPYRDSHSPSTTTDSSTHLIPPAQEPQASGSGHHRNNPSLSQSVSAVSQYTNISNSSSASTPYYHQDSGVRIPPQAPQVQEFPPMYTAR